MGGLIMELKIDDKEFAKALAEMAVDRLRGYLDDNDERIMLYHKDVGRVVEKEVKEIIQRNEEKILNAVVDKLAEKYMSQIRLSAVLSALSNKVD
jgi:hypothetical protein